MGIHYKFASAKDFSIIPIDGTVISVAAFKRKILESNYKSKSTKRSDSNGLCLGTDLDFIIVNAQSDQQYYDDSMLIPNHSKLLLRRVPGTRRHKPIDTSTIIVPDQQIPLSSLSRKTGVATAATDSGSGLSSSTSTVTSLSLTKSSSPDYGFEIHCNDRCTKPIFELGGVDDDEDSKILALVNTPALEFNGRGVNCSRSYYGRMGAGMSEKKIPPEGYVCHRCNVPGHFIQHCPTNGDPVYDFKRMKPVSAPVFTHHNEAAFEKEIGCLPTKRSWSASDVPPELLCPLCKQVMKDAVLTSKCCFSSFCHRCIRDHLILSKLKCVCGALQVLTDSLIPNITLRDTINRILEAGIHGISSSAENSTSKASSVVLSPSELSEKEQKPLLDYVLEDMGNKRKPIDSPNSMAKKARTEKATDVSVVRMEEQTAQRGVQTEEEVQQVLVTETEEELQQKAVAVEDKVQQNGVSGEKGMKKREIKNSKNVEFGNYAMPVASYAYNPYWTGTQAGMDGYIAPYY